VSSTPFGAAGSLAGLRVIEIGTSIAAPMAAQILGDLGAEVVKIEQVERGDDSRRWMPPEWNGVSVAFLSVNRNKKSVALNFKTERGRSILERKITSAHVLVQNLRPNALASAGFTSARIEALNPRLVHCDITGFGAKGPRAGEPAYDPLLQAYSGMVSMTGEEGGAPVRVPVSLLDAGTAMWTALAVYEGLRRRDATGRGVHVEVSLLQTALSWLSALFMSVLAGNGVPGRMGSGLPGVVPYGAFPTSDGHVFISAGNDSLWHRLCDAVDGADLEADERFASNVARVRWRDEVVEALGRHTSTFDTATLVRRLREVGVPCSPVNTLDAVLADEQVQATGMITPLPHDRIEDLSVFNLPMTFDGEYLTHRGAPPELGADTVSVLESLGFERAEIVELERDGVVGSPKTPTVAVESDR
jgi:crotonobetainyl-CoA:carnitine CoA-transferase CaiB-like acyl-CoA transferase